MSGSRLYIPCEGYQTSDSGRLLIDQATYDQLVLEKQISEKLEKAAAAMATQKAVEKYQYECQHGGYDYSADEVGEEEPLKKPATNHKELDGYTMQIFNISDVERRIKHDPTSTGDRFERQARRERLEIIQAYGCDRKLAQVNADAEMRLDGLEEDFPNFSEVIQYLRAVVAIAFKDDRTPQPQHLLLDGPPGIGKTLFSTCVAQIFGTDIHIAHLETMQTSADLVGTSSAYSNATTGLIFNALIEGAYANPMVLLDELDKATGDDRRPTTKALYNLLECTSASFYDECERWLEIDASRIMYVATSNSTEEIEPAILSRFRVFDIEAPSREQTQMIIGNIFSGIKSSRPRAFENLRLSDSAIEKLLDLSPRKIKAALTTAAGNAIIDGRSHICGMDVETETQRKRTSIGFVS